MAERLRAPEDADRHADRTLRLGIAAVGVALVVVGVVIGFTEVPPQSRWPVVRWLAGGLVVHDAVLAPAAVLLGVLVLRRVPRRLHAALRAGLLAAGATGLLGLVVVMGSRIRRNPTVLPWEPEVSALGAVLVVAVVTGLSAVLVRGGGRRTRGRGRSRGGSRGRSRGRSGGTASGR